MFKPLTVFPVLTPTLTFMSIPMELRHKRMGLCHSYNGGYEKMKSMWDWKFLDMRGASVRTNSVKLVDPEVVKITPAEQLRVDHYYKSIGRVLKKIPKYVIRDNDNGNIYLAQDCYYYNLSDSKADVESSSDSESESEI